MADIRINEQIAFLRKQRGMTQEELAKALGVTNQAVSKWEQGQCCPDIGLLPDLAKMFDVSVDELLGYTPASTDEDIILDLRRKIDTLPENEDFCFAFKTAAALHTIIVSKYMIEKSSCWDTQDAIKHAVNADWGIPAATLLKSQPRCTKALCSFQITTAWLFQMPIFERFQRQQKFSATLTI